MFKAQVQFQTCRYQGQPALSMNITPEQFSEEANAAVHRDDDPLTGLKNGSYLIQRLDDTAQHALAGGHDAQLFYIRLDQYEDLLATHGQEATNGLIRLIAERLDKAFYDPHLVCRFEDDSFAIIFRHPNTDESLKVARKLARQIAGLKLQHAQTTVSTSASVGVVSITDSAPPASELLHRARKAADELTDGNGCVLYQPPATLHPQNDSEAVKRVLTAISDRRLKLMFQPIVPLEADTETHNYEVLVRLLDENGETLAPNFFLTSIEQSDVMVKMDRWVLEHGLQQLREENDKGTQNRLFINLAGRSLHSNSLLTWFQSQLKELQVPPDQIVFQLSESDAAASLAQARRFSELASKLGCRFCLKHFGSSPNSQHVLRQLQIDYVKLDGAYIQDLESGDITVEQLHSQLLVAIERGATIIAPLVENTRVISKLFRCGIQLIQGYYLQPPRENMDYDYFQG
ncbi:MAG: hypothetical protein CMI01_14945 [Oceanospirillaceae bacterium]|nr:hypothetical protein [Oceanospirillaceae bacterium]